MDVVARRRGAAVAALLLAALLVAPMAAAQVLPAARFVVRVPDVRITPLDEGNLTLRADERGTAAFLVENVGNVTARLRFQAIELPPPFQPQSLGILVEPPLAEIPPNGSLVVTVHLYAFSGNASFSTVALDVLGESGIQLRASAARVAFDSAPAPAPDAPDGGLSRGGLGLAFAALAGAGAWGSWRLARRDAARWLAALALAPLYTRLAPSKLLDQEKREAIYRLVVAEPGINYTTLKERTGLPAGVLVHHLRTLERHRLVASRREGAFRRFAPVHGPFPDAAPAPVTPMQTRVLGLLAATPLTQRQIAEALGLSQQGANRHVKALERRGLLAIRFEEGEWRCHALASAAEATPARR